MLGKGFVALVASSVVLFGIVGVAGPAAAAMPVQRGALGAGYLSMPTSGLTSATATLVVPDVTCASNADHEHGYFGLFTYTHNTSTSLAAVTFNCALGTLNVMGMVTTETGGNQLPVTVGDKVRLTYTQAAVTTLTVTDLTTKTKASTVQSFSDSDDQVLVGISGDPVVPTFAKAKFQKVQINGATLGTGVPLTREILKTGADVQVSPSALNLTGDGFTLSWKANA